MRAKIFEAERVKIEEERKTLRRSLVRIVLYCIVLYGNGIEMIVRSILTVHRLVQRLDLALNVSERTTSPKIESRVCTLDVKSCYYTHGYNHSIINIMHI